MRNKDSVYCYKMNKELLPRNVRVGDVITSEEELQDWWNNKKYTPAFLIIKLPVDYNSSYVSYLRFKKSDWWIINILRAWTIRHDYFQQEKPLLIMRGEKRIYYIDYCIGGEKFSVRIWTALRNFDLNKYSRYGVYDLRGDLHEKKIIHYFRSHRWRWQDRLYLWWYLKRIKILK